MASPLLTKPQQCIQVYYTICDSHMDTHNIVVLKQNTYLVLLHILNFDKYYSIEHIFVPACSSARKIHFFKF